MEILKKSNFDIITPFCPKLDKQTSSSLFAYIENEKKDIALNLDYVSDCTIDFIEELKKMASNKKIGVFNISSDIFALFNLMKIDKTISLYVTDVDFEEDKH